MDVGVRDGGRGPLVLPDLGADVARQDDRPFEPALAKGIADRVLVHRVQVGVEQADGDRLHLLLREKACKLSDAGGLRRALDPAGRVEAFLDLEAKAPRHEGGGKLDEEVVDVIAGLPAELEDVAEPGRGDEGGPRPRPLDDGVRCLGGRMDHLAHGGRVHRARPEEPPDPLDGPRRKVSARREYLLGREHRPPAVHEDDVGERPPDVDADGERTRTLDPFHPATPLPFTHARAHPGEPSSQSDNARRDFGPA